MNHEELSALEASRVIAANLAHVDERVPAPWACPVCGEDRMDWLAWGDSDAVHCESCDSEYVPPMLAGQGEVVIDGTQAHPTD